MGNKKPEKPETYTTKQTWADRQMPTEIGNASKTENPYTWKL